MGLLHQHSFKMFVYGLLVEISDATWGMQSLSPASPEFGVKFAQIKGRIEGLMSVVDLVNAIEEEWEKVNDERNSTDNQ